MDRVAFVLLKAGRPQPKSAKQAEIRLADLQKILRIGRCEGQKFLAGSAGYMQGLYCANFRRIWLIRRKTRVLLSRSHF